jgi:hypothetical protein
MSDRKADAANVLTAMRKLFLGTDKEHNETLSEIAKDVHGTVKRVRRREGAINAIAEESEEEDEPRAELAGRPRARR